MSNIMAPSLLKLLFLLCLLITVNGEGERKKREALGVDPDQFLSDFLNPPPETSSNDDVLRPWSFNKPAKLPEHLSKILFSSLIFYLLL